MPLLAVRLQWGQRIFSASIATVLGGVEVGEGVDSIDGFDMGKGRKQDREGSGVNGVSGLRGVSRWPRIGHPDRASVERSIEENGRHSYPIDVIVLFILLDEMAVPGQRFNPWRGLIRPSLGVMLPRR
jgi:hypothetical protein